MSIADANVLLAILVEDHVHHSQAWRWWSGLSNPTVHLVPIVRLGVLRLLSMPVVMSGRPLTPTQALDAWGVMAVDVRCHSHPLTDLPDEAILRDCVTGRTATPNLWTDAWLAALAATLDEEFVTFDSGFRRFPQFATHAARAQIGEEYACSRSPVADHTTGCIGKL